MWPYAIVVAGLWAAYLAVYMILRGKAEEKTVIANGKMYQTNFPAWSIDLREYESKRKVFNWRGRLFFPLILIDSLVFTTFYISVSNDNLRSDAPEIKSSQLSS